MASSSTASNQDLLDLFDCPICFNFIYPPIYQCPNGHHLCGECKKKMRNVCPTCRNDIMGDIRSLVLEKAGNIIRFPCRYRDRGCSVSLKYDSKQKHEEKECRYRPYECPFPCRPRCKVTGDIEKLVEHLHNDHRCHVDKSEEIACKFTSEGFVQPGQLIGHNKIVIHNCLSQYFCLNFVTDDSSPNLMSIYMTFMGEESKVEEYRYKLEVEDEGFKGKATWEGSPLGIRELVDESCIRLRGMILHKEELVGMPADFKITGLISDRKQKTTLPIERPLATKELYCKEGRVVMISDQDESEDEDEDQYEDGDYEDEDEGKYEDEDGDDGEYEDEDEFEEEDGDEGEYEDEGELEDDED